MIFLLKFSTHAQLRQILYGTQMMEFELFRV